MTSPLCMRGHCFVDVVQLLVLVRHAFRDSRAGPVTAAIYTWRTPWPRPPDQPRDAEAHMGDGNGGASTSHRDPPKCGL